MKWIFAIKEALEAIVLTQAVITEGKIFRGAVFIVGHRNTPWKTEINVWSNKRKKLFRENEASVGPKRFLFI